MKFIVVTGLSGSGKSVALNTLEDLGFYCIDNLPSFLLESFADALDPRLQRVRIPAAAADGSGR